jgi:hypothetical protein
MRLIRLVGSPVGVVGSGVSRSSPRWGRAALSCSTYVPAVGEVADRAISAVDATTSP